MESLALTASTGAPEPAVFLKPKGLPTRGREQLILVIEDDDDDVKKPIRNPLPSSKKRSPIPNLPLPTPTLDFEVPATSKYEEIALGGNSIENVLARVSP